MCYSGGADGADLAWGEAAKKAGFKPIHYSFPGHKTNADRAELKILNDSELRIYNSYLAKVAPKINRTWPPKHAYVRKLLQRNGWQVKLKTPIYAVGMLDENGAIKGGTAWAVQLAINLIPHVGDIYFFDQDHSQWYKYEEGNFELMLEKPPKPTTNFTGVGTRELNDAGAAAIIEVFE